MGILAHTENKGANTYNLQRVDLNSRLIIIKSSWSRFTAGIQDI